MRLNLCCFVAVSCLCAASYLGAADVQLEGMSGIDLLRHLRSLPSKIPVVVITARDRSATRAEAEALGCVDYLQKPFDAGSLIRAIERCVAIRFGGAGTTP